jgi:hypothetical protein
MLTHPLIRTTLALLFTSLLAACPRVDAGPTLPELEEGWTEVRPGGDTTCARGEPFSWFIRPGTVNKLIVDFQGGGACWDEFTCSIADAIFQDSVDPLRDQIEEQQEFPGLYNREDPDNPFRDWYHAVVPYCTGDIHWGDATTTYGEGLNSVTINHRGAVNAKAVMDWLSVGFSGPEQILSTGCSAGAYGAALYAAHLAEMYPDAMLTQLGDSGAGIITQAFFNESFPQWNAEPAFPNWIPELDPASVSILDKEMSDLYVGIANHYPDHDFAQFNSAFDRTQVAYFDAMGGSGAEAWSLAMRESIDTIVADTENFSSYIAPGDQHCILFFENFYTTVSDSTLFIDWLRDLAAGTPPQIVSCQGEECDPTDS